MRALVSSLLLLTVSCGTTDGDPDGAGATPDISVGDYEMDVASSGISVLYDSQGLVAWYIATLLETQDGCGWDEAENRQDGTAVVTIGIDGHVRGSCPIDNFGGADEGMCTVWLGRFEGDIISAQSGTVTFEQLTPARIRGHVDAVFEGGVEGSFDFEVAGCPDDCDCLDPMVCPCSG